MDTPPQRLTQPDAGAELKAAVSARHDLGSDLEDQVLEAFLARVEQRIDAHVDQKPCASL